MFSSDKDCSYDFAPESRDHQQFRLSELEDSEASQLHLRGVQKDDDEFLSNIRMKQQSFAYGVEGVSRQV